MNNPRILEHNLKARITAMKDILPIDLCCQQGRLETNKASVLAEPTWWAAFTIRPKKNKCGMSCHIVIIHTVMDFTWNSEVMNSYL